MSVSVTRQSSYSARSISSSSARSISSATAGFQLVGASLSRLSNRSLQSRSPSVYGGAGGYGTRISTSSTDFSVMGQNDDSAIISNEKMVMQNLNDRLASYLDKVRSLESANRKLELQIREFFEKRAPADGHDFTAFFATITDLQAQIQRKRSENQSVILQIDNAQMAAEDFKMKYEMELNLLMTVEADIARLRGVRDSLTLTCSDLEMQIEGLKDELIFLKRNHEEEMQQARLQQTGNVSVEVDSAESVDMSKVLEEMREQYEAVVLKNKQEIEKWFKLKVEALQTEIVSCTTGMKTSSSELSELRRTYQSLEITRQGALSGLQFLQQNLEEIKSRYSVQLSQLQQTIIMLETELQHLRVSIEKQQSEYNLLLDIKMRLELEIAEYRRLLEGEQYEKKVEQKVVISKVVEVEEHKPHIERRVRTIVEEIVDGKVVSHHVDTQVEDIQ